MKCRNCDEKIDEFVGKETGAKAYLHVIKFDSENKAGYFWAWIEENKKHCRNPEPKEVKP